MVCWAKVNVDGLVVVHGGAVLFRAKGIGVSSSVSFGYACLRRALEGRPDCTLACLQPCDRCVVLRKPLSTAYVATATHDDHALDLRVG